MILYPLRTRFCLKLILLDIRIEMTTCSLLFFICLPFSIFSLYGSFYFWYLDVSFLLKIFLYILFIFSLPHSSLFLTTELTIQLYVLLFSFFQQTKHTHETKMKNKRNIKSLNKTQQKSKPARYKLQNKAQWNTKSTKMHWVCFVWRIILVLCPFT